MNLRGSRKLLLGMTYVLCGFACIETALLMEAGAGVIAAVAGACVSVASGLLVVIGGNVKVHEAQTKAGGA